MREKNLFSIQKIWQVDNYTFAIEWKSSTITLHRLSTLQRNCPCAGCTGAHQEEALSKTPIVKEDVQATSIKNVGNYALAIHYTSGCSAGIYDYDLLRSIHEENR